MRRPLEILAAGVVLGELTACAGISRAAPLAAAACLPAALFALRRGAGCRKAVFFLVAFLLGFVRMECAKAPSARELLMDRKIGAAAELSCEVEELTEKEGAWLIAGGGALVTVPAELAEECEMPEIGNRIELRGKLSRIKGATNPGEFDFASYYRAKGITHRMYAQSLLIADRRRDRLRCGLRRARLACLRLLAGSCESGDAGFLGAALLGERGGLQEEMYELYRRNGIAHLLAISGLHTALVGLSLYRMLRRAGAGFSLSGILAGAFLIFYCLLTGGGTGVVRAALMLLLSFAAAALGRNYDLRSALGAAAAGLLLVSPLELFQCGFQLSFLAVLAIGGPAQGALRAAAGARARRKRESSAAPLPKGLLRLLRSLAEQLLVSCVIFVFTLPVLAYWFFSVPPYSVLLNLAVIPLMTYVLGAGIAALAFAAAAEGASLLPLPFFGAALRFLSLTAGGAVHRILQFYTLCCRMAERLPGHRMLIGRPRLWQIALCYALLLAAWRIVEGRGRAGRLPLPKFPAAALLLCLAPAALLPLRSGTPLVWFLDVGQGDAIVIECGNSCVTIDGGSTSSKENGRYILEPFLLSRGIARIDAAFITHADADHTNGIEYLLTEAPEMEVGRVFLTAAAEADDAHYGKLKEEIRARRGLEAEYLGAGDQIGAFRCLWPRRGEATEEVNEHSLVLLFASGGASCLFTGDAGSGSEREILKMAEDSPERREELRGVSVLKAGHHGSAGSSSAEFLELLRPEQAILSYGKGNRYGHPHPETLERLEKAGCAVRATAREGAICIPMRRTF